MTTSLVLDGLNTAAWTGRTKLDGLTCHADAASQYTSVSYTDCIDELGVSASIGTVGGYNDNSPMESFWATMQIDLLNRKRRTAVVGLSLAIADYNENFYNVERRHSSLEYFTLNEVDSAGARHKIHDTRAIHFRRLDLGNLS